MDHWEMLAPALLYAETHFRFFGWSPSFLFRRRPEVIFDAPARLAPRSDLPIVLLINDLHRFPAILDEVTVTISAGGTTRVGFRTRTPGDFLIEHPGAARCAAYLFEIERDRLPDSPLYLNAKAALHSGARSWSALNDNLVTSRKSALYVNPAPERLPGSDRCRYGDIHTHSWYSESHVEFGPPIAIVDRMTDAYGLDFAAITDHSYDLACDPGNYLLPDPAAARWRLAREEFETGRFRSVMIPGEEASVYTHRRKTVHMGVLGNRELIPGVRDGARGNARKDKTLSIPEALRRVREQGACAFAAHPGARPGLAQRLFLHRGRWRDSDFIDAPGLYQGSNGDFSTDWHRARALWIRLLLKGVRLALVGGNDAHGDFNRYRSLGIPFLSIREMAERHFGYCRTGVYGADRSVESILDRLRRGATFVTSGPYLTLCRADARGVSLVGQTVAGAPEDLIVHGESGAEAGAFTAVRVFQGVFGERRERMIVARGLRGADQNLVAPLSGLAREKSYVRAEAVCIDSRGRESMAATSPCYLDPA
jgi:hypothetical protein